MSSLRSGAENQALSQMAAHGWTFLPSAGISRPVASPNAAAISVRSTRIPGTLPLRPRPGRPYYWGSAFYPWAGYGYGGGCFFNGFTSFCGANPYLYNAYGANYCLSGINFYDCGYGGGYGPGYGYGYGPGPGYGADWNSYPGNGGEYESPNNSGATDVYVDYIGDGSESAEANATEPRLPPTQIILKNGSAYEVTAYWVSKGELYYRPVTGGLSHVPLEQLDLSATVEANSRNGVTFKLTDHPPQE